MDLICVNVCLPVCAYIFHILKHLMTVQNLRYLDCKVCHYICTVDKQNYHSDPTK